MRRTPAVALSALAALLLTAPSALAAQRWTTPTATLASGACAASAPCRIDVAVNAASAGDEVIVAPGVYHVAAQLSPVAPIDLHGVAGQRRPRIVGSSALTSAVLSFKQGGTVRHLYVEATGAGSDAITLQHGVGEDLLLRSAAGDGGKIVTSAAGTVLRDSAVRTNATGDAAALKLRESSGAGTVSLHNVTLMAPSAYGVRCEVRNGQASIVNAIVHGSSHDIEAGKAPGHCTVANSNFRAALSPGVVAGAGNQEAEPVFVDAPKGNYRPAAGSPTVDAGASDALLGTADPAGCARTLGAGPDIGAYEHADPLLGGCAAAPAEELADATPVPPKPPAREPTAEDIVKGIPAPVIGDTVVVAPGQGSVLVRRPGTTRFRKLDTGKTIPVGSTVDAREGRVHLVSAIDADGTLQKGTFWGSKFQV